VKSDPRILGSPETAILVKELAGGSVVFQVRSWVKGSDYWDVYFGLIEAVKKHLSARGISFPMPTQNVHVYDHGKV
jgi:small conductance mechanosensitive channel